jgi:hypothetical protein
VTASLDEPDVNIPSAVADKIWVRSAA